MKEKELREFLIKNNINIDYTNWFKDAEFGTVYVTKCGKRAMLFGKTDEFHILIVEGLPQFLKYSLNGCCIYFQDSLISDNSDPDKYDIVGKYKKKIDVEKLYTLAHCADSEFYKSEKRVPENHDFYIGFEHGYIKAIES